MTAQWFRTRFTVRNAHSIGNPWGGGMYGRTDGDTTLYFSDTLPLVPPWEWARGQGVRNGTRIMIFNHKYIPVRRIKLNETDNLENEKANEQTVSSDEVSEIIEDSKEQTEQPKETEQDSYLTTNTEILVEQVSQINQKLDTVSNILIVSMVGMAILVGITACNIFSRYFKS